MGYVMALVKEREEDELRCIGSIPDDTPIITLSSLRDAKRVVTSYIPDAILIERDLADGHGIEFVTFLESRSELANIPIVALVHPVADPGTVIDQTRGAIALTSGSSR